MAMPRWKASPRTIRTTLPLVPAMKQERAEALEQDHGPAESPGRCAGGGQPGAEGGTPYPSVLRMPTIAAPLRQIGEIAFAVPATTYESSS